jgi:hypothetical protein
MQSAKKEAHPARFKNAAGEMDRSTAQTCQCGIDTEDAGAPSAVESALRLKIAILPPYALSTALADYERDQHDREPCCPINAALRVLHA